MDVPPVPLALWMDASMILPDHSVQLVQPTCSGCTSIPVDTSFARILPRQVNTDKLLVSVLVDLLLREQIAREGIAIKRYPLKSCILLLESQGMGATRSFSLPKGRDGSGMALALRNNPFPHPAQAWVS